MVTCRCGRGAGDAAGLVLCLMAGLAQAGVVAPASRAIELPPGAISLRAEDAPLAAILDGARTDGGGKVTHDAGGKTFGVGKTLVTWKDSSDGSALTRYVYVYPHGWQVLGWSADLHTFEPNAARHVLHDRNGRVHVIYSDGQQVWYRLGRPEGERVAWQAAVCVGEGARPAHAADLRVRGQTLALVEGKDGVVDVQCAWSSTWPDPGAIWTRRLAVDAKGGVAPGPLVNANIAGAAGTQGAASRPRRRGFHVPAFTLMSIAADSSGGLHLIAHGHDSLVYAFSRDGEHWSRGATWQTTETASGEYRYASMAVDSHDRVHAIWQTMGYRNRWQWWVGLYTVRDPKTGQWSKPVNVLDGNPEWQAPDRRAGQVLFAYPNMVIDDRDNVHIAWHGTARSHIFGQDDVFYLMRPHDAMNDSWGAWTGYAVLHQRDHFQNGQGEDGDFSWVPSLAYRPGSDDVYALIMFGSADDEVPDANVNTTDGALKVRHAGQWQRAFENVTQTRGLRSWYPNVAPKVWVDEAGRAWLDMIWVDGTLDDYNVLFRRIEVGQKHGRVAGPELRVGGTGGTNSSSNEERGDGAG